MASGDVFSAFGGGSHVLTPQNGIPQDYDKPRIAGPLLGYPLRKQTADGVYIPVKVPNNGTPLSTGITVEVTTVDDPNNADGGNAYVLGLSGAKVVGGTTNLNTVTLGTETTATVTANATQGIPTTTSMAITTANLNTPVAGNLLVLLLRRVGTSTSDTHRGVPLILEVVVKDT